MNEPLQKPPPPPLPTGELTVRQYYITLGKWEAIDGKRSSMLPKLSPHSLILYNICYSEIQGKDLKNTSKGETFYASLVLVQYDGEQKITKTPQTSLTRPQPWTWTLMKNLSLGCVAFLVLLSACWCKKDVLW